MNWRLIRRYPDGREEVSDMEMGLDIAHKGQTFKAAEPGKDWKLVDVRADLEPPTLTAELVDAG
jgi:hypothetical protein